MYSPSTNNDDTNSIESNTNINNAGLDSNNPFTDPNNPILPNPPVLVAPSPKRRRHLYARYKPYTRARVPSVSETYVPLCDIVPINEYIDGEKNESFFDNTKKARNSTRNTN